MKSWCKFRVGDLVRVIVYPHINAFPCGRTGRVLAQPEKGKSQLYEISVALLHDAHSKTTLWREDELELAENGLDEVFKWLE
jgi:hypothetical protein